ncbi:hypothetical protein ACIQLK_01025 [Microbacterium sp. NPDC091382]|uniref:hypothetical protein n=1 Tax=Microbacterium sp. NPDC091382 TaxID=3364210 RepID=UPI00381EDD62
MTTPDGGRSLVVDEQLSPRLARGFLRWQLTRPSWIVLLAVTAGIVALSIALTLTGSDGAAWLGLVMVILLTAAVIASWVAVRSSIHRAYPVGSEPTAALTADSLIATSALGTSEIRFTAFRRVDAAGDAVLLKVGSRLGPVAVMPRALLSEADIAHLRAVCSR